MGKLVLKIGQMNPPASWEEKYQLPKGELPAEWAEYMVAEFNRALKPGEPTRYLMGVTHYHGTQVVFHKDYDLESVDLSDLHE